MGGGINFINHQQCYVLVWVKSWWLGRHSEPYDGSRRGSQAAPECRASTCTDARQAWPMVDPCFCFLMAMSIGKNVEKIILRFHVVWLYTPCFGMEKLGSATRREESTGIYSIKWEEYLDDLTLFNRGYEIWCARLLFIQESDMFVHFTFELYLKRVFQWLQGTASDAF